MRPRSSSMPAGGAELATWKIVATGTYTEPPPAPTTPQPAGAVRRNVPVAVGSRSRRTSPS